MIDINELRRLAQAALVAPDGLSAEWMDRLGQFQESVSPTAIIELLDRLEAAERGLETERMRLAACSVAALGYFEGCAKKYTSVSLDDVLNLRKRFETAERERDELHAKIAAMERQEPACEVVGQIRNVLYEVRSLRYHLHAGSKLYTLPGAKGE